MKIALDAMGGDSSPSAEVEGAILAAREFNTEIVLVGDEKLIRAELEKHKLLILPFQYTMHPSVLRCTRVLRPLLEERKIPLL